MGVGQALPGRAWIARTGAGFKASVISSVSFEIAGSVDSRTGNISLSYGTLFGGLGMNRVIVFGVAAFFAVVGIALVGGQSQAVAGLGRKCQGANARGGEVGCAAAATCCEEKVSCVGRKKCAGRVRSEGRVRCEGRARHARRGAGKNDCCGQPVATCCGETVAADCCGVTTEAAPTEAAPATDAPPADAPATEAPVVQ